MGAKTYYKRLDRGYPGNLSRVHEGGHTLESKIVGGDDSELLIGAPATLNENGEIVPVAAAANVVFGFVVRPYPSQGVGSLTGEDEPLEPATVATVMRRGYMTVQVAAGTPAVRGQVYVVTTAGDAPVGSISAASTKATAIPGAFFTGDASAEGIAEIEYKI